MADKTISITKAVGAGALLMLVGAGVGRVTATGTEVDPGGKGANVVYDFSDAGAPKVNIGVNKRVKVEVQGTEAPSDFNGYMSHRGAGKSVSYVVDGMGNVAYGTRAFVNDAGKGF